MRRARLNSLNGFAIAASAILACLPALAQAQARMPTETELQAVRDRLRMPSDAEIDAQRGALPKNFEPPSRGQPAVDIEALAKRLDQAGGETLRPSALGAPALYVFVSLGMPRESLAVLAEQAARAKATLVMRGVVDRSFLKTTHALRAAIGDIKGPLIIDPRLFERFDVGVAPTFVLASASAAAIHCSGECARPDEFAKLAGDVSLDYALRHISSREPSLAALANSYLARLAPGPR